MPYDVTTTFLADLGLRQVVGERESSGWAEAVPALCWPGTALVRSSVLGTLADMVCGGLAHQLTLDKQPITLDLSVRWLRPDAVGTVVIEGTMPKGGATVMQTECWFRGEDRAEPFAFGQLAFIRSPRPQDVIDPVMAPFGVVRPPMPRPIADHVECRVVGPGVVEVERHAYVLNPSGTIQGGIVALAGELAAESAAGEGQVAVDLDVRYLSATRVGPARATAAVLARSGAGAIVRVEIRDMGNAGRLSSVVMARTAPAGTL